MSFLTFLALYILYCSYMNGVERERVKAAQRHKELMGRNSW